MNKILLVDDQPPMASHHRTLFGDNVDICTSYDEFVYALNNDATWSAAFVDFDLAGASDEARRTGLSILRLLKKHRPDTRRIVYTTLSDNGRTLFAAAAYHWLDTEIILDKSSADRAILDAGDPTRPNPTMPGWKDKLASAYLVDHLFAREHWLPLWRIWSYYNGSIDVVREHAPPGHTPNSILTFSKMASEAMESYKAAFHGHNPTSYERKNTARATPLVAFADSNSKFFDAIDLQEVLDDARPWLAARSEANAGPQRPRKYRPRR